MIFTPAAPVVEQVSSTSMRVSQVVINTVGKSVTIVIDKLDVNGNKVRSDTVSIGGAQAVAFFGVNIAGVTLSQVITKAVAAAIAALFSIAAPTVTTSADQDLAAP